jgi:threonine/homoserine/homoserine lactone efflux protein
MSTELLLAFVVFAVATLFTPGPNNVMLMSSGLSFGFEKTLPASFGVSIGFSFMVAVVGLGLGAVFAAYPVLYEILKFAGAAYLLYLAWRIWNAHSAHGEAVAKPFTFLQAAAFQWVNAKGWVMAVGAITTYAAIAAFPGNIILIAAIFLLLGTASSLTWVLFGTGLRKLVDDPKAVRIFNRVMAALLVLSIIPVFVEG